MSLPRVVCEYEDVFPDELPGLPPLRDVDFRIELHPGTLAISMTPHRMAPVSCRSSRSRYKSYWARVSLDRALHHGALRFYLRRRRIRPSTMHRLQTVEQGYNQESVSITED